MPSVDVTKDYFRVRQKDPKRFKTCRTPAWASRVSGSISKGSKVVMCKKDKDWVVKSVLIKKGPGKNKKRARNLATKIRKKIERR